MPRKKKLEDILDKDGNVLVPVTEEGDAYILSDPEPEDYVIATESGIVIAEVEHHDVTDLDQLMNDALDEEAACSNFCYSLDDSSDLLEECIEACLETGYEAYTGNIIVPVVEAEAPDVDGATTEGLDFQAALAGVNSYYYTRNDVPDEELFERAAKKLQPIDFYIAKAQREEDYQLRSAIANHEKKIAREYIAGGTWPKRFQTYEFGSWQRVAWVLRDLVTKLSDDVNRQLGIYIDEYDSEGLLVLSTRTWRLVLLYPKKPKLDGRQIIVHANKESDGSWGKATIGDSYDAKPETYHKIAKFLMAHLDERLPDYALTLGLLSQYSPGLRMAINCIVDGIEPFDEDAFWLKQAERKRNAALSEQLQRIGFDKK